MHQHLFLTSGLLFWLHLSLNGQNLIPGTAYKVHDMSRPQPRMVTTSGPVEIKPPSDAVVLFNGENLDAWMSEDHKEAPWEVTEGVMIAREKDIRTKEEFGAIQLHMEWRLAADHPVNAQLGGNSGCFFMGLYEVQILQSHNNPTYPDGQAAALYGQKPPLINATSVHGEWNSYDIIFVPPIYEGEKQIKAACITVIHNGMVVQNAEEFLGTTTHKKLPIQLKNHPKTGPIRLQFHNDPIEFRNIWVRPLGERDQAN